MIARIYDNRKVTERDVRSLGEFLPGIFAAARFCYGNRWIATDHIEWPANTPSTLPPPPNFLPTCSQRQTVSWQHGIRRTRTVEVSNRSGDVTNV